MADVAVVTGAGTGIGRAVAAALLDAGFRVALAGRRREPLQETAGSHGSALVVPTDVTDEASVSALFAAVRDRWGRVDLLFNNAGGFGPAGLVDEIDVAQWRAFLCAREAFAAMRAQRPRGGRIVNNGSISAHVPRPGSAAYTATKHAISGLTKTLALDGRPFDIVCGQIDIGNAATEMTAGIAAGARQADGTVRPEPTFDVTHVADAVLAMARLPLGVTVQSMTIAAAGMPFVGRG